MFYDVILEGLKKFAGEIIGVILLIAAWRIFPGLRKLFGKYNSLKDSESKPVQDEGEVERLKNELQRQKEALAQAEAQKAEEAKRREEMQRELEAKHFAAMGDDEFIELCKSGDVAQVKKAIEYGANANAGDNMDWTALRFVTNNTRMKNLLRSYGAK